MKHGLGFLIVILLVSPLHLPQAWADQLPSMPRIGQVLLASPMRVPPLLRGIKLNPHDPLQLTFYLDSGSFTYKAGTRAIKQEAGKMVRYFLSALTIPEKDLWVNLSPYEKNRMVPSALGQTTMGRDMLAQDYVLKQFTASLIYPEGKLGQKFWQAAYAKTGIHYQGMKEVINTFNKVWIVPQEAHIEVNGDIAFIRRAHLKVMLEADYTALNQHTVSITSTQQDQMTSLVKSLIIPEIEREVNEGANFAPLRQMFYSMILAAWFKMHIKDSIVNRAYANKGKVSVGINQQDPATNDAIYTQYLQAYKKGVFNYIKEDVDEVTGEVVPRKYFSGGADFAMISSDIIKVLFTPSLTENTLQDDGREFEGELWPIQVVLDPVVGGELSKSNYSNEALHILQDAIRANERTPEGGLIVGSWSKILQRVGSYRIIAEVFYKMIGIDDPLDMPMEFQGIAELELDMREHQLLLSIVPNQRADIQGIDDVIAVIQEQIDNKTEIVRSSDDGMISDQEMTATISLIDYDVVGLMIENLKHSYNRFKKNEDEFSMSLILYTFEDMAKLRPDRQRRLKKWTEYMKEHLAPQFNCEIMEDKDHKAIVAKFKRGVKIERRFRPGNYDYPNQKASITAQIGYWLDSEVNRLNSLRVKNIQQEQLLKAKEKSVRAVAVSPGGIDLGASTLAVHVEEDQRTSYAHVDARATSLFQEDFLGFIPTILISAQ